MLEVKNLSVSYGAIAALHGVSLSVPKGDIVTLIGGNGAGKTTTLRAISGLQRAQAGEVIYEGRNITNLPAHEIVQLGLAHVPEGRMVFANLTVLENLQMGAYLRSDKPGIAADMDYVFNVFPRLKERAKQISGTLSGGEQQLLAIGRGLMSRPKLLLLDEPSMGLAPIVVQTIFQVIRTVNAAGVTILRVEQNARAALELASRAYVMESGLISMQGEAKGLLNDERVRKAYLGEAA